MLIAFLLALIMETIAEVKSIGKLIAYILVSVILSLVVNTLFALIVPETATTLPLTTALLQRFGGSILGLIIGKIVRYVAIGKS